jgi:hypothetical protein
MSSIMGHLGTTQRVWCSGIMSALTVLVLFTASHACEGGNATSSVAEGGVHVSYHGAFGTTQRVCCSGSLCQLSLLLQPQHAGVATCCSVAHTGPLDYQGHGLRGHPTLVSHKWTNEVGQAWDSLCGLRCA